MTPSVAKNIRVAVAAVSPGWEKSASGRRPKVVAHMCLHRRVDVGEGARSAAEIGVGGGSPSGPFSRRFRLRSILRRRSGRKLRPMVTVSALDAVAAPDAYGHLCSPPPPFPGGPPLQSPRAAGRDRQRSRSAARASWVFERGVEHVGRGHSPGCTRPRRRPPRAIPTDSYGIGHGDHVPWLRHSAHLVDAGHVSNSTSLGFSHTASAASSFGSRQAPELGVASNGPRSRTRVGTWCGFQRSVISGRE